MAQSSTSQTGAAASGNRERTACYFGACLTCGQLNYLDIHTGDCYECEAREGGAL